MTQTFRRALAIVCLAASVASMGTAASPNRVIPERSPSASATRETFPTFAAAPSTRAIDHTPVGSRCCPVTVRIAIPGFLDFAASRHPREPVSASNIRREYYFGAASFALCYGPRVCLALLTG